jgi:6-phosphogluconolactonase (cycloisomerase 2 family)
LYAAGVSYNGGAEVLEYRLPLKVGEQSSGSLTATIPDDYLAVALQHSTLYVAATTAGTISAYSLPLRKNEQPQYTIATTPDPQGADDVAVSPNGRYLYASIFSTGDVYQYALPYHDGDVPTELNISSQTGQFPNGIAVRGDHLFVSAGELVAYRLPITATSKPTAIVQFNGDASGLATSN